jgi:hypothetical protein
LAAAVSPIFQHFFSQQDLSLDTVSGNFSRQFNGSTVFAERPQLIGASEYAKTEEEAYEEATRGVWTVMIN